MTDQRSEPGSALGCRLWLAALILLLPLVALWPLPAVFTTHLLAAPDQEAATHSWGLWAALQELDPLVIRTTLLGWPDGVELVLVDPANLPAFALGSVLGPAAGYNLVLYAGLVLMGVAGALLARELQGDPLVGAAAAQLCPTLLANAADGMTEGFGVGWVGIFLASVLRFRRDNRWRWGLAAGASLAAACYAGPYNGVWAAGIGLVVGGATLLGRRWRQAGRMLAVAAGAGLLVSPLGAAIFGQRAEHLPGSASRAGLPRVLERPEIFRGGIQTGADLLDPWLPVVLTGGEAPISHTAYLGLVPLLLAGWGVLRDGGRGWRWLLGAVAFSLLSLGPWLYFQGEVLQLGDRRLLGPAGVLMLGLSPLARLTRWYRAGAVASLLLAPLVARLAESGTAGGGARRLGIRVVVVLALAADALLLAPLAWPLHHSALPDPTPYAPLRAAEEGAVLMLPPVTTATPPPGHWRDLVGLTQPLHGRPTNATIMRLPVATAARKAQHDVEGLMRTGRLNPTVHRRILDDGFRWLALHPAYRPLPADAARRLVDCFGPPLSRSDALWLFDLQPVDLHPVDLQPTDGIDASLDGAPPGARSPSGGCGN